MTFQDAKQACADEGASLPIVSSEDENESLVTLLESLSKVHRRLVWDPYYGPSLRDMPCNAKIETMISKFCSELCMARHH